MAVLVSLLAALVYGAADFYGGLASRRTSAVAVVAVSQLVGLLLLAAAIWFVPGRPILADLRWGALAGVLGAAAILLLYRALAIGTMGIVSPITAVLAAIVPVAFAAARGQRPSAVVALGIVLAIIAVACISASGPGAERDRALRGLPEAFAAGIAFGVFFIFLALTSPAGGLWPLLAARGASVVLFALGGLIVGIARLRPARSAVPMIAGSGALDMLANVLYVVAAHEGSLAVVAVLTSLYPASTVALAAIVVRERLARIQWVGVGFALAGVAAITTGR